MKHALSLTPSPRELIPAAGYLAAEILLIPTLALWINTLLPTPLTAAELNCAIFVLGFLVVTWIFRRFLGQSIARLHAGVFPHALIGLILYFCSNAAVATLILGVDPEFLNVNDSNIAAMAGENFPMMALCTVFLVPVKEELLFRGLLFGPLYRKSPTAAYCLSVVAFSAIHLMVYVGHYPPLTLFLCFLQYIPAGVLLARAWTRTDNILTPILMHIVINALGMMAMR